MCLLNPQVILRDLYSGCTKDYSEKQHYAQMALINLFSVHYYKGLVQEKDLYPIVLQALKAKNLSDCI